MDGRRRDIISILIFLLLLIAVLAGDFAQWDIINAVTERHNGLASGLLYYFITGIRLAALAALFIWSVKYAVSVYGHSKFKAVIPIAAFLAGFTLQFIFPLTQAYTNLEYRLNKGARERLILMFEENDLSALTQTDENVYLLPSELRLASRDAKIETIYNGDVLKISFCASKNILNKSDVIYVSNMGGVEYGDFYKEYSKLTRIDDRWYSAEY